MTYKESLNYLYNRLAVFHQIGSSAYKPGLDNTIKLMNAFGNPHLRFRAVHIAGTNGKGSVSNFLAAVLQVSGYKVGLYTSPHLVDFGERIRINGEMISEDFVVNFIDKHKSVIEAVNPSFFELTMAMSFCYFADNEVDIAIIEAGLGGRLDSTNVITPMLSVITNIGYDHMEYLGNSLQEIAAEKAGIIKPDIPVIIGESQSEVSEIFINQANKCSSPISFAETSIEINFIESTSEGLIFSVDDMKFTSGLRGFYQLKNIRTVLHTVAQLKKLNFEISVESLKAGLMDVCRLTGLRGRWDIIKNNPLIIADTGHNVPGITEVVKQISLQQYKNLSIVIGMVNDKDISRVLEILPVQATYYFCNAQTSRALSSEELYRLSLNYNLKGKSCGETEVALQQAITEADIDDLILITGSNFVVGEAYLYFESLT